MDLIELNLAIRTVLRPDPGIHVLPPYCPELNRIEKFWFTVKHRWMKVKCRTHDELIADISEIFDGFGDKYTFDFYAK